MKVLAIVIGILIAIIVGVVVFIRKVLAPYFVQRLSSLHGTPLRGPKRGGPTQSSNPR